MDLSKTIKERIWIKTKVRGEKLTNKFTLKVPHLGMSSSKVLLPRDEPRILWPTQHKSRKLCSLSRRKTTPGNRHWSTLRASRWRIWGLELPTLSRVKRRISKWVMPQITIRSRIKSELAWRPRYKDSTMITDMFVISNLIWKPPHINTQNIS